jgi:hypothetical protein
MDISSVARPLPDGVSLPGEPSGITVDRDGDVAKLGKRECEVAANQVAAFQQEHGTWAALDVVEFLDWVQERTKEEESKVTGSSHSLTRVFTSLGMIFLWRWGWIGVSDDRSTFWPQSPLVDKMLAAK